MSEVNPKHLSSGAVLSLGIFMLLHRSWLCWPAQAGDGMGLAPAVVSAPDIAARSPCRYTPLDFTVCKVGTSPGAGLVAVSDEQPGNHHGRWNHRGGSQQPAKAATQALCSTRAPQNADSGCAWCWSLMFCSPQVEQEQSLSGTFGVEDTKIQSLCPSQGPPSCSYT